MSLKMLYNNLDGDHSRTLNKYLGALTELLNMVILLELIYILIGYWNYEKMVFRFETVEITPTIEEIRDCVDTVDTGLNWREKIRRFLDP